MLSCHIILDHVGSYVIVLLKNMSLDVNFREKLLMMLMTLIDAK